MVKKSHLDGGQTFLAVPLLNTYVDVVLGIRGVPFLISRVRKRICAAVEASYW